MKNRRINTFMVVLLLGLAIIACGKKPKDVEPLPGAPNLPTKYPTG